jgi:hypothetical protein
LIALDFKKLFNDRWNPQLNKRGWIIHQAVCFLCKQHVHPLTKRA